MAPRLPPVEGNEPSHPLIGVTESTTTKELKGNAGQESVGGGAYGTSPSGTEGASSRTSPTNELWVICPLNFSSALHKAFKANSIGATELFISTIQDHEPYQRYLELIKKHRVNLNIELPKREEGHGVVLVY